MIRDFHGVPESLLRQTAAARCSSPTRSVSAPTGPPAPPGAPEGVPCRASLGQQVFGERDVRDQHEGPDALHGVHRDLRRRGDMPLTGPAHGPLRPQTHLVPDDHSAHRTRTVRAWPADHSDRIESRFLPSYSPELHPNELVGADPKTQPAHAQPGPRPGQLASEIRRFHRLRRHPRIVRGYFGGPHVRCILEIELIEFPINKACELVYRLRISLRSDPREMQTKPFPAAPAAPCSSPIAVPTPARWSAHATSARMPGSPGFPPGRPARSHGRTAVHGPDTAAPPSRCQSPRAHCSCAGCMCLRAVG